MSNILFKAIDNVNTPRGSKDLPNPETELQTIVKLAESLLLCDNIWIPVGGPNLHLATLFRWLDKKTVEKLIEEKILKFLFVPGVVTYMTNANIQKLNLSINPGLHRLVSIGDEWKNPFDSTFIILKEQTNFRTDYIRYISNLMLENFRTVDAKEIFSKSFDASRIDVRSSLGNEFGFNLIPNPDDGYLQGDFLYHYIKIAEANTLLYLSALINCDHIYGNELSNKIVTSHLSSILNSFEKDIDNFKSILKFETVPDFSELFANKNISLKKIIELRGEKHSIEFRDWLKQIDTEDKVELLREYSQKSFNSLPNTFSNKSFRLIVYTGIGIGLAFAEPITASAVTLGLNTFDIFLLDKLIKKWNPKMFISQLNKEIAKG